MKVIILKQQWYIAVIATYKGHGTISERIKIKGRARGKSQENSSILTTTRLFIYIVYFIMTWCWLGRQRNRLKLQPASQESSKKGGSEGEDREAHLLLYASNLIEWIKFRSGHYWAVLLIDISTLCMFCIVYITIPWYAVKIFDKYNANGYHKMNPIMIKLEI